MLKSITSTSVALAVVLLALDVRAAGGEISAAELLERMATADAPVVLDVRSPGEYAAGHVPGAINMRHDQVQSKLSELEAVRDRDVVVYCKSGHRAGIAGDILTEAGFRVLHLEGDMKGWAAAGHPQETPPH